MCDRVGNGGTAGSMVTLKNFETSKVWKLEKIIRRFLLRRSYVDHVNPNEWNGSSGS